MTGLQIYKLLPKTNCKDCGVPTCLAFAMQLAAKKASLDKCPHVSQDAKNSLSAASEPPIKLVTIGTGEDKIELGNETVMFRHEERFHHPCGIGFIVDDTLSDAELDAKVKKINGLKFERVGQHIKADTIALRDLSNDSARFKEASKRVSESSSLALVLMSENPASIKESLGVVKDKRPLIFGATEANIDEMAGIAKENGLPLVIESSDLEKLGSLAASAKEKGLGELILYPKSPSLSKAIDDMTQIRRLAIKKNFRPFGYPMVSVIDESDKHIALQNAASLLCKYSNLILLNSCEDWQALALLAVRQDIYTDPQKPVQVEPKVYEIGDVTKDSPVIVTTNFSITYFTVAGEVESSKVPTYIIACDAEGMSVLTAWAAEKFTPDTIAKTLEECGIKDKVSHKNVIIPGYVAVMSGKLEEDSGWKVIVGPREANGLSTFLKNIKVA